MSNYRLCRITETNKSPDNCVKTVTIGYLPRKKLKNPADNPGPLETKVVAIQRLSLILPVEEQEKPTRNEEKVEQTVALVGYIIYFLRCISKRMSMLNIRR